MNKSKVLEFVITSCFLTRAYGTKYIIGTRNSFSLILYRVSHPSSFIEVFQLSLREFRQLVGRYCS